MLLKPPPDGKRVVDTSWSAAALAPGGRKVEPRAVTYGHEAGKSVVRLLALYFCSE